MMAKQNEYSVKNVKITSDFWNELRQRVAAKAIPYQWDVLNDNAGITAAGETLEGDPKQESHAIENFRIASGKSHGAYYGYPFQDTDAYKWLEAAAYSLRDHPNADLKKITDGLVDLIADTQESDGYLSTYFQIRAPERKFKRLAQSHELYSMGHYIEAGIAYYQSTGSQKALDIAVKMADCVGKNFGPEADKIHGYDGHPEIEIALSRLYELTNEQKYLDLAHYFLKQRGVDPDFFARQIKADGESPDRDIIPEMRDLPLSYYQAGEPIKDQKYADGHAVRMVYLCTGIAYVARYTGDQELLAACRRFWNDIVKRRMYITGNVGSTTTGEAFTYDYDLPNDTDYGETCASVAMSFFARQMLNIEAKGEYGDILEKEIFNGTISGMALDGQHFFYVNPLTADPEASKGNPGKSHILTRRAAWFVVACCPTNLARLVASIDQYIYTVIDGTILSNQFIANDAEFKNGVTISQTNHFPWEGDIHYQIKNPTGSPVKVGIRIPAWTQDHFDVKVNGSAQKTKLVDGFIYFDVDDALTVDIKLDMQVKYMRANNRVSSDFGKVAIQRGPMIYCAEEADNGKPLWTYRVDPTVKPDYQYDSQLLKGVGTITLGATRAVADGEDSPLYTETQNSEKAAPAKMKLIPYYAWANRQEGQMTVWLNEK